MVRNYNGILRKPFLSEHWHKGFVAALAIWLPVFSLAFYFLDGRTENSMTMAIEIASTVSLVAAFAVFTHYEGFSMEFDQLRYRPYTWVLGFHFGKWQKLPPIAHVVVKPFQRKHGFTVSNYPELVKLNFVATEQSYQVLLSVVDSQIGIIAAYASQKKAFAIAAELSQLLDLEVLAL